MGTSRTAAEERGRVFRSQKKMPKYTFRYFNFTGRGEICRLVFAQAGVEFTDHRISGFEQWIEEKQNSHLYPFGTVPTLEIDGTVLPERMPILRYLANEFGLNGKDTMQKAWCEVYVETLFELWKDLIAFSNSPSNTRKMTQEEKDQEQKEFFAGKFPAKLKVLEGFFKQNNEGKGFLVGDEVTVADLMFIDSCESFLKLEPTCLDATPLLKALNQKVLATPKIKAYMESRPPNPF